MSGFKKFLMQGNVIDLAVAVMIGAAFQQIVDSFVKDIMTPLIGVFGGIPDFSELYFTINGSKFMYGDFINHVVSFIIVALVIYFVIVRPYTRYKDYAAAKQEATTRECPECLTEIPIEAKRCSACCAQVGVG
ncbi:large conductance mechanosensitive channel protein MscL [Nonomuraea soli]|uniref:Large-conductance mechanosensitive channel n=1 Tax=Nonomuraea soli TaxID=1032476 RepID=A0A7W0CQG6_9ACTN|nr:large conductance mechanosensitive channel protein MscL [Nonomuraea soli]MBA2895474.1 large conductance mechanosensitive channel [Nonomuraea soli]